MRQRRYSAGRSSGHGCALMAGAAPVLGTRAEPGTGGAWPHSPAVVRHSPVVSGAALGSESSRATGQEWCSEQHKVWEAGR